MFCRTVFVCIVLFNAQVASSRSGASSAAQGDIVGQSDFQINLRPPVENAKEIQESLNALVEMEDTAQAAFGEAFVRENQRMLAEEKAAIHNLVEEALQPLVEKLK